MPQYKIVNPSAGNVLFDTGGTARTVGGWHVGSGVAKGLGARQTAMSNSAHGIGTETIIGSIVPSGLSRTAPATTAGSFANFVDGQYVIVRVTTGVAGGVANTTLRSGAGQFNVRDSIHKVKTAFRTDLVATAIRDGEWVAFSGIFSPSLTANNESIGNIAGSTVTNGTADHEANVTRADQGSFTYKAHALNPTSGDYSAKLG